MYVNIKLGKLMCFRCGWSAKTLEGLCRKLGIAVSTDLSTWDEAVRSLIEGSTTQAEYERDDPPEPTGLPPCVPIDPCSRAAHYLSHRGFDQAAAEFFGLRAGIGKIEDRIVIPTFDVAGKAVYWVARACGPKAYGPKYMNPPGSHVRFHVFNLRSVLGAIECRINEGPMSGMASGRYGTATFGKHMSRQQEAAYVAAKCGRYVVAYDGTARIATLNTAEKLREDGLDVWIAAFPNVEERKDPASMPLADREAIYAAARPYSLETRLQIRAEMLLAA